MSKTAATIRVLIFALLSVSANASDFWFNPVGDNRFDPRVDLNNLNWFDRGIYKASLPYQDCIDLNEFYAYADSNQHDNLDRSDIEEYSDRLSYSDYKMYAGLNPHDGIEASDYPVEDMRCSSFGDYTDWMKTNPTYNNDDYFELFGFNNQYDYDRREDRYPTNDYIYTVDPYGLVRTDGQGGFSSLAPFDWYS